MERQTKQRVRITREEIEKIAFAIHGKMAWVNLCYDTFVVDAEPVSSEGKCSGICIQLADGPCEEHKYRPSEAPKAGEPYHQRDHFHCYDEQPGHGNHSACCLCLKKKPAIEIVPSPRIDWCGDCKAEHGYECPKDRPKTCTGGDCILEPIAPLGELKDETPPLTAIRSKLNEVIYSHNKLVNSQ